MTEDAADDRAAEIAAAQRELAETNRTLQAAIEEQNGIMNSTLGITSREMARAMGDVFSGALGGRVAQRSQTAGNGHTMARY